MIRPITHIITSGGGASSYNRYKIKATGCVRETGNPQRYCQWGYIGLGSNGNNPVYGFTYYTVESYQLVNGTYWATYLDSNYPLSNWLMGNNNYKCDYTYNSGLKDDCYAEVIFTTNETISPTSIGLVAANNANSYPQRPEHFYLYGWNGSDWDLLIDVLGENTNSGNSAETIVPISGSQSSTIIRPLSIFEIDTEPIFPYQTVQIGNQIWMAETLRIDDGGEGIYTIDNCTINGVNYGTVYYYTCAAATRVAATVNGWHLPSKSEVDELVQYVNGGSYNSTLCNKMKSTTGWSRNGTDDYGWNAKPLGMIDHDRESLGNESTIWQTNNYRWYMTNSNSTSNGTESDYYKFPIRLIKDT